MVYLKKYFTEGLIQVAILLSLCGVRVDVGLEPYLPPSWQEMILGPTSALTQTQFHNLRNRLDDGQDLHPKSVDLDGFFTARRLLGWVRSLDRLQVPRAELETWLVQREPDPLPMGCPDQPSPLGRANAQVERDRRALPVESRAGGLQEEEEEEEDKEEGTHYGIHHSGTLDESGEEEEEEEGLARMHRRYRRTEGREPGPSYGRAINRELTQNEVDQTVSLQECFRLLEETFPFTEEQQLRGVGAGGGELERRPPGREPLLPPTGNPSLDLELQWQDLLAIMEPQNTEVDMVSSFDDTWNSRATGTPQGVESEALWPNCYNHGDDVTEGDQEVLLMETPLQHGLLGTQRESELQPTLLPLTPSAELDDHSSALNNSSTFNISLLTQDLMDTTEGSPCSQCAPFLSSCDVNFYSRDLTPSSFTPSPKGDGMTKDLLTSPFSIFPVDEEDAVDESGLPGPFGDLLEDSAILDEIRLLDLALEEGFGPEMAARLEDEGFLDPEISQQETGRDDEHPGSSIAFTEDQGQPRRHQQDGENEADSDSGLSLDLSHSPASPCASEASSYSFSSSSCVSDVGSPFSEDEDEDAEEVLVRSDMEVEVTIKQEELEEENMGAVGGGYPEDVKKPFPPNYGDHKLFNGFPWLEHIDHDHTYNQPWSFASSPSLGKMPTKHTKSPPHRHHAKPYRSSSSRHISKTKMWSRDERRAQTLKVPFSIELIVNLPVEEFNDLLANYQLSEEQLTLVRDIRRRGKNKVAAQNCRKRKLNVLLELKDDVSGLKRYRSRLLREKQEALRNLQEMKHQLGMLYQDVFSRLTDEEGRPLNAMEYLLHFEPNGSITVAPRKQGAVLPLTKSSKKQRDKKK